ncbi:MAG: UDP-N-acetylmuramate--L-alanine ligase [Patescibacteria group bacterium]|nr:UDP-N-acetylmuramate--L-alanine ligase [Patescibacteria group bacterium]
MDIKKIKQVHLIGIGGIGISAIAKMMIELKKQVSGSDLLKNSLTQDLEKLGAKIFYEHNVKNLDKNCDLVIYSPAIENDNPELVLAKKLNIQCLSHFDFLGGLSKDYTTIAITGTHGKSTTTALVSMIMIKAGLDPTVFVGTKISKYNSNFILGKSKYLVVEADEYDYKMLKLFPDYIGFISLDKDHLDVYKNLKNIKDAFQKFVDKLKSKSNLIYNSDDINIRDLKLGKDSMPIGLTDNSDLYVENVSRNTKMQIFDLCLKNKKLCKIETSLPGAYNIYNILVACAIAIKLGIKPAIISQAIRDFRGLWRRFEFMGNWHKNLVFSDYAHHPTAVKSLLQGVRGFYQNRKITIVFQPHQEDRTEQLFDEFLNCFELADNIVLYPVYKVSGRRSAPKKNAYDLYKEIKKNYLKSNQDIYYTKDFKELKKILSKFKDNVVIITGAGNIDDFVRNLEYK